MRFLEEARRLAAQPLTRRFLLCVGALCLLFIVPLWRWAGYAWTTDEASHALLIPLICAYLVLTESDAGPAPARSLLGAMVWGTASLACVAVAWVLPGRALAQDNALLAWQMAGFACGVLAAACWFLGSGRVRHHLFAALFLFFIVPPPTAWVHAFSQWLQLWSADAAELLFRITGTTLFRSGQTLMLAGIRPMEVAEECSGVRSTLVLLITALLAGKLLFRSNWSRAALFFAVIPLGILRNGFRIVTIGLLCVHIDQSMIDSWIHRRGGPVFFALSLVPLLLLAKLLQVIERRRGSAGSLPPPPG